MFLNLLCGLCFLLLAGTGGWTVWQIVHLNMLASRYLWPLLAVLVLVILLLGFFLLPKLGKKSRKLPGRIIACVLALLLSAGFGYGATAIYRVNATMDAVTTVQETEAVVDVFVLQDSPATTLEEVRGLTFGWTAAFDGETAQKALQSIEETLGTPLTLREYDSVLQMVGALDRKEVDCILLNRAYLSVMEGLEGFSDFMGRTRSIYSYSVTKIVEKPVPAESMQPETPVEEPEPEPEKLEKLEPFVVYVSGSDTRSRILETSRSDVNILAVVNPETRQVLLVNTPRDYFIPNPVSLHGNPDKLTHCGIYGVDCSMQALAQLYNQKIDYYGQINFTGFEALIDAIGGVTVWSDQAFDTGSFSFCAGENSLNGEQALAFARERYAFASGDNQRGKNQMKVITAVIEKATSGTTIISNYAAILESMQGMFATSVPRDLIEALVKQQLADMAAWNIRSYAVSGVCDMQPTYSAPDFYASVMWPDEAAVAHGHDLIEAVKNNEILTDEMLVVPAAS